MSVKWTFCDSFGIPPNMTNTLSQKYKNKNDAALISKYLRTGRAIVGDLWYRKLMVQSFRVSCHVEFYMWTPLFANNQLKGCRFSRWFWTAKQLAWQEHMMELAELHIRRFFSSSWTTVSCSRRPVCQRLVTGILAQPAGTVICLPAVGNDTDLSVPDGSCTTYIKTITWAGVTAGSRVVFWHQVITAGLGIEENGGAFLGRLWPLRGYRAIDW